MLEATIMSRTQHAWLRRNIYLKTHNHFPNTTLPSNLNKQLKCGGHFFILFFTVTSR